MAMQHAAEAKTRNAWAMRSRYLWPQRRLEVPCPMFPDDSTNLETNFVGENVGNMLVNKIARRDIAAMTERSVPTMVIQSALLLSTVLTSCWSA